MYPRSSTLEKSFASGTIVLFLGLAGIALAGEHPSMRTVAFSCVLFGGVVSNCAWFVGAWDRNPLIMKLQQGQQRTWLVLAAIVLWIGFLPLAYLWVRGHTNLRP
jgi:hypothetical protein